MSRKLLLQAFSGRSAFCGDDFWKLSVWSGNEFPFRLPGLSILGDFSGPSVSYLRWASWKKALQLDCKLGAEGPHLALCPHSGGGRCLESSRGTVTTQHVLSVYHTLAPSSVPLYAPQLSFSPQMNSIRGLFSFTHLHEGLEGLKSGRKSGEQQNWSMGCKESVCQQSPLC